MFTLTGTPCACPHFPAHAEVTRRGLILVMALLITLLSAIAAQAQAAPFPADGIPDPKTGGAGGGRVSVLFLSTDMWLIDHYKKTLEDQGFTVASARLYDQPLAYSYLKRFNVLVLDRFPLVGDNLSWKTAGYLNFQQNMEHVWRCMREGAGVLVFTDLFDTGEWLRAEWNELMRPWGIQLADACIVDPDHAYLSWGLKKANRFCWTENLAVHPTTRGLQRIYYPSANARWDNMFTAPPLLADKTWTPLIKAMPGARKAGMVDDQWVFEPADANALVIAAARPAGKGRLAVLGMNPFYVMRLLYRYTVPSEDKSEMFGEYNVGPVVNVVMKTGDGVTPSDTGTFVSRLYAWLAQDSAARGFGGWKEGDPVETEPGAFQDFNAGFKPTLDFANPAMPLPPSWRHCRIEVKTASGASYLVDAPDPQIKGTIRPLKALVGIHSAFSDGKGSIAEYAGAARRAGYAVLAFTESFELMTQQKWEKLVDQCARNTTDNLVCLPGLDVTDKDGNRYLIVGQSEYLRPSWLTPDGKRLVKVQMINFGLSHHVVIAHRSESGPLPYERLKHFTGVSVAAYRRGAPPEFGLQAFAWQAMNASQPHPFAVHEIFSPAEVREAAAAGFQQIMPTDTPRHGAEALRIGWLQYYSLPWRGYVSEGPVITRWVISNPNIGPAADNRRHFRVGISVAGDAPLNTVTLFDGPRMLRTWRPNTASFDAIADFQHSRQYDLYLVAEDARGRRAISSVIRTTPERSHFRCADRQNWLGHVAMWYTGTFLPLQLDLSMPVKGTDEASYVVSLEPKAQPGSLMAVKLNFPFTCNDVVLTEAMLDNRYTSAIWKDIGLDAMPSEASTVSTVYAGKVRCYNFTQGTKGQPNIALIEYNLTLKRDVEPRDPAGLFPSFGPLRGEKWAIPGGSPSSGTIAGDQVIDVPKGGLAGGFIALSDNLAVARGKFGLKAADGHPATLRAGTRLTARFLVTTGPIGYAETSELKHAFDADPAAWLQAMGFGGPPPYELKLTRGTLDDIAFTINASTDQYGVAGTVAKTATIPYQPPMRIAGLNEHWVAGIWRENGEIAYTGVFEQTAWPRLDVSKPGKFYAGNLLTSDNPDLVLDVVAWNAGTILVEAHNPTEKPIEATIATPPEIENYQALRKRIVVPAGSTVYVGPG